MSVEITATEQAKVESCFMVPSSNWLGGQPFTLEIGVRASVESPPWLARLSIDTPVINPVQVFSMFLPGIINYKETTAPQLTDWPRGANPMRCLRYGRKQAGMFSPYA